MDRYTSCVQFYLCRHSLSQFLSNRTIAWNKFTDLEFFDLSLAFYLSFFLSTIFHLFCLSRTRALSLPCSIDFVVGQLQVAFIFFVYDSTIFNFISRHTLDHHFKFVLFHTKQSKANQTNQPIIKSIYWYSIESRAAWSENCLIA